MPERVMIKKRKLCFLLLFFAGGRLISLLYIYHFEISIEFPISFTQYDIFRLNYLIQILILKKTDKNMGESFLESIPKNLSSLPKIGLIF
jgi:hypothetical protein